MNSSRSVSQELFKRGSGIGTDIVKKEMYIFEDRGGRSVTLRPEGTPSVVRAYLQSGVTSQGEIAKLFYIAPMFRYEKPQKGRFRQHVQFGAECFGIKNPAIDAEMIIFYAVARRELFEKVKFVRSFSPNNTYLILKISYYLADIGYGETL